MTSSMQYVLVTGANGGLGQGICLRLVDEFLSTRPSTESLTLIFTTRSTRKGNETKTAIQKHLNKQPPPKRERIHIQPENVDLTDLLSVRSLARKINESSIPHLNAIILNAGIGGWSGLNWPLAVKGVLTNWRTATTWPEFKIGIAGLITKPQFSASSWSSSASKEVQTTEPPLGQIFCANVFGHYMLAHWLMPVLRACDERMPGRIIWISSIEPQGRHLDEEDLQAVRSGAAYESTKRLTDVLALTYNKAGCAVSVSSFTGVPGLSSSVADDRTKGSDGVGTRAVLSVPTMHVTHPGILPSTIIALYWIVHQAYYLAILIARVIGGVWSTVDAYPAAIGSVWLALTPLSEIDQEESRLGAGGGRVKWGSAASRLGTASVQPTDVDGWGINGSGESFRDIWWAGTLGRAPGAKDATRENVEEFEAQGTRVWKAMEVLRKEWEDRLETYERANG